MNTRTRLLVLIIALSPLMLASDCEGPQGVTGPPGDPAPVVVPATLTCEPPTDLSVTISNGGCDATHCFASLGVIDTAVLKRARWLLPSSDPDRCQGLTCNARWLLPAEFPASFPYSVVACTSTEAEDPDGQCCAPNNGNVRFAHAVVVPVLR